MQKSLQSAEYATPVWHGSVSGHLSIWTWKKSALRLIFGPGQYEEQLLRLIFGPGQYEEQLLRLIFGPGQYEAQLAFAGLTTLSKRCLHLCNKFYSNMKYPGHRYIPCTALTASSWVPTAKAKTTAIFYQPAQSGLRTVLCSGQFQYLTDHMYTSSQNFS